MAATTPEWVVIGKVVGAHGIRGEIKVALFMDDGSFLKKVDTVYLEGRERRPLPVKAARTHHAYMLLTIDGVNDRNAAELLRGRDISVPFAWLPTPDEGEFYVAQIMGLRVETTEGELLGTVTDVIFTGANEVYVVKGEKYGEVLLPAIESVIDTIDPDQGVIKVTLPEGLID